MEPQRSICHDESATSIKYAWQSSIGEVKPLKGGTGPETIETTYLVKGNYHIVFTRALPLHVWEVGVFIRVDLIIKTQNIVYSGVDIIQ